MQRVNRSDLIRSILQDKPGINFNDAEPIFKAKKVDISRGLFNTVRGRYMAEKPATTAAAPSAPEPQGNKKLVDAIGFVYGQGGLAKTKALLTRASEAVRIVESFVEGNACSKQSTGPS